MAHENATKQTNIILHSYQAVFFVKHVSHADKLQIAIKQNI